MREKQMPTKQQSVSHPAAGLLTTRAVAGKVGVAPSTIRSWKRQRLIRPVSESPDRWDPESVRQVADRLAARKHGGRPRGQLSLTANWPASTVVDAVLATAARAARSAGDTAVERWLTRLLERGVQASGSAAGPEREKKQGA